MPFPWSRYWRRVAVIFVLALLIGLAVTVVLNGRLETQVVLAALVNSAVLAVVGAFPLTQRIYRGPRR